MVDLFHPAGSLSTQAAQLAITPEQAGWTYAGLQILRFEPGEEKVLHLPSEESALVPLDTGFEVVWAGRTGRLRGRASVFAGVPDVAYVPVDTEAKVVCPSGGRLAVASAVADEPREPRLVPAEAIPRSVRGAGQASRVINGLLSADVVGPQRLIVVEVITPAGNWSSYPPHKHDEWSESEVPIEEIYYFQIAGDGGFGLHRTYTADGAIDATVTVRDRDVFLVPRGYHGPCVAAPGYDMYYLNVMAGPDPERRWMICNDPVHDWVTQTWNDMKPDERAMERLR